MVCIESGKISTNKALAVADLYMVEDRHKLRVPVITPVTIKRIFYVVMNVT